jgi:IPT/TIG domain/Peptidase M66
MDKQSVRSSSLQTSAPAHLGGLSLGILLISSVLCSGGCGGGSVNSSPAPAPKNLPSITNFSPTSGPAGTSVTVTGTNLTGATAVSFNGAAAAFQVASGTTITATVPAGATSGKILVTTPGGSAASTNNFSVTLPAPVISSFSPTSGTAGTSVTVTGSGFTGATSVKFNGSAGTFSVTDDSHISATVPSAATTGNITVTAASGTATSTSMFTVNVANGLDLTIDGLYVTQTTQNYPTHDVSLIQGRSAWVRVFVLANQNNTATPQVQVQFINGSTTNTLTINAPGASVPTAVNVGDATTSWNVAVPAAWIQPGVQVVAVVDPTNQVAETNKGNNQFSESPVVQTVHQWKITLIPVKTGDGRVGVITNSTRTANTLVDVARRLWPVPDTVDVTVGAQMTSSAQSLSSDGTGWSTVLNELLAKRTADGVTDRYYFGFVNVSYTSGVAGLGYIGQPAAMGWDYSGAEWVLAHEEGHNFGRQHSPCGGASNPDPNYPYAGGIIGVPGWDVFAANNNLKPSTDTDIMGYCSNQWISDYTYKGAVSFRVSSAFDVVTAAAMTSAPKEGLLVWGRVEGGKVTLEPAFRVPVTGAAVQAGPYVWEGRDAQGRVLSRVAFQTYEVEDLPYRTVSDFAFVVPMDAAVMGALESVHVLKDGSELAARRAASTPQTRSALNLLRVEDLPARAVGIDWDSTTQPMVMLRDARTGEVRGFLRGGSAQIGNAPDEIEVQLSDGVRSSIVRHTRTLPQ